MLTGATYTSARPYGVGTTRDMGVAGGALQLRERFFLWDESARRHAFCVEQCNVPLFRSFAEYYEVQRAAKGCRFTWNFASAPHPRISRLGPAMNPANKLLYDSFISDTRKHFERVAKS
jgi:hypothetical protein